jgi:cobalamin biosynthesis protein CbiG
VSATPALGIDGPGGPVRDRVVVGIGARRGTGIGPVRAALAEGLAAAGLAATDVIAIVTVAAKQAEPAFDGLAGLLGVPLHPLPAELLARQPVPNPSAAIERLAGTPSVAEAAVLAFGAELLMPKRVSGGVTIAIGRLPVPPTRVEDVGLPAPGTAGFDAAAVTEKSS